MIDGFYKPFHTTIEHTLENAERAKGERDLGIDEESGKKVIARMGRYGPMVQIGDTANEEEKPRFAKLKQNQFPGFSKPAGVVIIGPKIKDIRSLGPFIAVARSKNQPNNRRNTSHLIFVYLAVGHGRPKVDYTERSCYYSQKVSIINQRSLLLSYIEVVLVCLCLLKG